MQIASFANLHGGHVSLFRALVISIVFHLLLLWPATVMWREAVPAAPLVATLRPSLAPVVPSPRVGNTHGEPAVKPQRLTAPASNTEPLAAATPDTLDSTASSSAGSGRRTEEAAPDAHPAVSSALLTAPGLDADGLRIYRLSVAREARRYKRYPLRAIEAAWAGTVELRVDVPTGIAQPTVQLIRSSGYPVLDEAALEMVRQALPTTPVPIALREQGFSVNLPIVFELPQ